MSVSPEAPRTSRPRWLPYAAAALALVVAAVLVVVFVVKPGGNSTPKGVSPQTPEFEFTLASATPVTGAAHTKGDPEAVATKAGDDIKLVMDRFYSLAFLDPHNWQKGNYATVFGFFDQGAASKKAEADVSTLTLGSNAGRRFSDVQPAGGTLSVRVLVDEAGVPVSAAASVEFQARATGASGPSELVTSKGQYFMHILEGGWTIFGYSVSRHDKPLKQGPSPSGSPS